MGPNVLSHCLQKGGQLKSPLSELADGFVKITGHNHGPRSADGEGANTHRTPMLTPHSVLRRNEWRLIGTCFSILTAHKEKKGKEKNPGV